MPEFNYSYFSKRRNLAWRAPIFCDLLNEIFIFDSVIDVGCSIGEFIMVFEEMGKDAWGLDSAVELDPFIMFSREHFIFTDIRMPYEPQQRFDLCLCLEVASILTDAECIPLVQNLVKLSDIIIMTQPRVCEGMLLDAGYQHDLISEAKIQEGLTKWRGKPALKALYNSVVFRRM